MLDRIDALPDDIKTTIRTFAYGVMYEAHELGEPRAFRICADVYTLDYDTFFLDTWEPCDYGTDVFNEERGFWEQMIWTYSYDEYLTCLTKVQAGDELWTGGMCSKIFDYPEENKEEIKL